VVLPYPKPVGRTRIRVKAAVVLLDERAEHHATARGSTPEVPDFHRPLGDLIKRGERSAAAATRLIAEQLGATLVEAELLGVLESIFTIEGEIGHEVVFVYAGRLLERDVIPRGGRPFGCGDEGWVEWRPVAGLGDVPLFPEGTQELLDARLSRAPGR